MRLPPGLLALANPALFVVKANFPLLCLIHPMLRQKKCAQTPVSNPYEDFDEVHDREHFSAAVVELDCKTPGGMFNFCRPRSGTVYESAKGPGPGFFSEAVPAAAAAAAGGNRPEQDAGGAASPVGVLPDVHQGCTIA